MGSISFGTDGWRARFHDHFTDDNVARVARAAAEVFLEDLSSGREGRAPIDRPRILIGYDTRERGAEYAQLAAEVIAATGLEAVVSTTYCPTPTLCWSVARDPHAIGGLMITASHNPGDYSGIKIRMEDGGASPAEFTDRLEDRIPAEVPLERATALQADLMTPYLDDLVAQVDSDLIRAADLTVVVDSLYGAARGYSAHTLRRVGVTVEEIHADDVTDFGGLHPEPIMPWIGAAAEAVKESHAIAAFVTDGDADRICAFDEYGTYVSPQIILALLTLYLTRDRGLTGRVVTTLSSSALLKRLTADLGLELVITPVGFKWIYAEMLAGDFLIGGEESGGIGIPSHVRERDGLYVSLLLTELMAKTGRSLAQLVADLQDAYGHFHFQRDDLRITPEAIAAFRAHLPHVHVDEVLGEKPVDVDRRDGLRLGFDDDSWILLRPSGTEPLVRIYAEAETPERRDALLAWGHTLVESAR